jgi:hypothetical protein
VSIALFFLLSGFFLSVLLGAIEHSAKLLIVSGACLAAVVCIIVFLTPVKLPSFHSLRNGTYRDAATTTTAVEDSSLESLPDTTEAGLLPGLTYSLSPTAELSNAGTR